MPFRCENSASIVSNVAVVSNASVVSKVSIVNKGGGKKKKNVNQLNRLNQEI